MNLSMARLCTRVLVGLLLAGALACSNDRATTDASTSAGSATQTYLAAVDLPAPFRFVTHHETTIGGQDISFTATAGEIYVYNDDGDPTGSIFSYAYVRDSSGGTPRPVAFITGGGPGSASNALHVGGFGPWSVSGDRLDPADGRNPSSTPPYDLVENQNSLLDVADLVFVDPVGTGYSRAIGAGENGDFWGIDEDAESMAQFIQAWITDNGRWNSPKFFMGASYGGYRAGPLTRALMAGPSYLGYHRGIALNGVIVLVNNLMSPFGGLEGFSLEAATATEFPSQALTAWYHHAIDRRGRSLEAYFEEVLEFAVDEYLPALEKEASGGLTPAEREGIVTKLTAFNGMSPTVYSEGLSLTRQEFAELVLAERGLQVGAYDSRYTLPLEGVGSGPVSDDAALSRIFPVLAGAFANLEREKLGVRMPRRYVFVHWRNLLPSWNMRRLPAAVPGLPGYEGTTAGELATAMNSNDNLFLMLGTGYFDLVMPAAGAQYTAGHTPFPQDRLVVKAYAAGHEIYTGPTAAEIAADVRDFIRMATAH